MAAADTLAEHHLSDATFIVAAYVISWNVINPNMDTFLIYYKRQIGFIIINM